MKFSMCQLEAVFCDDLRVEQTGKKIYVGVYNGAMLLESFPAHLQALRVVMSLYMTSDRVPKESIRFALQIDDEVLVDGEPGAEVVSQLRAQAQGVTEEGRLHKVQGDFNLTPVVIDKPCVLRVRAYVDGEEIRAPGLRVQAMPDSATDANSI